MIGLLAFLTLATGGLAGCEELLPRRAQNETRNSSETKQPRDTSATTSNDAPASRDSSTADPSPDAPSSPRDGHERADDAPAWPRTHTISQGETLYAIARHYYGDGSKWTLIEQANPGIHTTGLLVGAQLTIPAPE